MAHSLSSDLSDSHLFDEDRQGEYEYGQDELGKSASGYLVIDEDSKRDAKAQTQAGGEERRQSGHEWGADDGGHLIGARFGGATGEENLTAQARNLNRSGYKQMENNWAAHVAADDKVFVHIETLGSDRPTAYMGYAIYEHPDGSRDYETFSYNNEGKDQVAVWETDLDTWEAEHPEEARELYGSDYEGDAALGPEYQLTDEEQEYDFDEADGEVSVYVAAHDADEYLGAVAEDGQTTSAEASTPDLAASTEAGESVGAYESMDA